MFQLQSLKLSYHHEPKGSSFLHWTALAFCEFSVDCQYAEYWLNITFFKFRVHVCAAHVWRSEDSLCLIVVFHLA